MRIAVIDMGTNTFHLLIVEVSNGDFRILYKEKAAVKIGEKGINKGMITEAAQERALSTLHHFKAIIEAEKAERVFATATSAIRNAKNGEALAHRIELETGISPRIISGLQEAEYIYYGVKKALTIGDQPALIMDIGGGSIEFIIGTGSEILWKQSFEIGALRLVEKFQKHDPILPEEITSLESYFYDHLAELMDAQARFLPKVLIGSSGTFDTLSDIYRFENNLSKDESDTEYVLTLDAFHNIYQELITKNKEERLEMPGMIPLRVEMIVVACVLVNYIIRELKMEDIRVSAYALKEGVLLDTIYSLSETGNPIGKN